MKTHIRHSNRTIGVSRRRSTATRLAAALCPALLLSACGTVEWVKTRFVEPAASAPAPSTSGSVAQRAAPAPAPKADVPAAAATAPAPSELQRAPLPPATRPIAESAPQQGAPLPPPAPVPAPAVPPAPTPAVAAPAPHAAPAAPAASGDLAAGRWAVQVGVFFVANSAEAVRSRVAARLAQSGLAADSRATRVVKRDNKYFVVVGEAANQAAAEALASRVRAALKQDVALFRR